MPSRRRRPSWRRPMAPRCARIDAIEKAKDIDAVVICTPTDTHADLIERFAKAGKAIFCEKPIDLDVKRVEKCLAVVDEGRRHADGRLQPPLRSAFRRRAQGDRRRRHRHGRDGHHHLARSRPAAARLHQPLGRHLPRHDHPRLRHGALPARRGAGGGQRARLGAGRQEDRRGRRFRQRQRHPRDRVRQAVRHLQLAPRHLWLRPAHRGAWLEGHDRGREPAAGVDRTGQRARAIRARRCTTSS